MPNTLMWHIVKVLGYLYIPTPGFRIEKMWNKSLE